MKVIVVHTVVCGKGDKSYPVLPGPKPVDTKTLGLSDGDVDRLLASGHLAAAALPDEPAGAGEQ